MTNTASGVTTVDPELTDMLTSVFAAHRETTGTPPATATWDDQLWSTLTDLGLVRLTGSEASGGSGAGWSEAAELLRAAAAVGIPTPIVEHDLLAGWMLELAGLAVGDHRRSACVVDRTGTASSVGWATDADRIAVLYPRESGWAVADRGRSDVHVTSGFNRAGEPRDRVEVGDLAALTGTPVPADTREKFWLRGALARSVQVTGALESILRESLEHTGSRIQFGRPLSRFQAIQNIVSDIAAETALARAATEAALFEALRSDWAGTTRFKVAVARSCSGHAASVAVRGGHQVHGAIGTTREHRLHEFTRPALAWRAEFGSVASWDREIAETAVAAGPDGLWPLIAG